MEFNEYDRIDDNEYDEDYGCHRHDSEDYGYDDYRDDRPDCNECGIHKAKYMVYLRVKYVIDIPMCKDCVGVYSKLAEDPVVQKRLGFSVMREI